MMEESPEGTLQEHPRPSAAAAAAPAVPREDCWTEEATRTLVEAWGERYVNLNRGNLRQQHWQEVADAVNSRHGGDHPRSRRTDVQCKYRIDTLKKRYKAERARVTEASKGSYISPWPFFSILDSLIGAAKCTNHSSPPDPSRPQSPFTLPAVPVRPRSFKRSAREHAKSMTFLDAGEVFLRRKCTGPERDDSNGSGSRFSTGRRERIRGGGELVRAIRRLGEVYERVERRKQREMVELEKQRMEFAKELEQQRMRWFVEMQVQLQKMENMKKRSHPSPLAGQWSQASEYRKLSNDSMISSYLQIVTYMWVRQIEAEDQNKQLLELEEYRYIVYYPPAEMTFQLSSGKEEDSGVSGGIHL